MQHFSPKKTSVITQFYNATHRFKAPSSRGCKTTPKHKSTTSMFDCCEWSFLWIVNIFSPVNIVLVYYRKALIWSHLSTEHCPLSILACSGVFWWTPVGLSCDSLSVVGHSWVSYHGAPLQVAKSCTFFLKVSLNLFCSCPRSFLHYSNHPLLQYSFYSSIAASSREDSNGMMGLNRPVCAQRRNINVSGDGLGALRWSMLGYSLLFDLLKIPLYFFFFFSSSMLSVGHAVTQNNKIRSLLHLNWLD